MDLSYTTIPTYEGNCVTLYRQPAMRYKVEDPKDPMNELMCVDEAFENLCVFEKMIVSDKGESRDGIWSMYFDGSRSRTTVKAEMVFVSPISIVKLFSYRLGFGCTNNIAKYEALMIGLDLCLDMKIKFLRVTWDFDLIVSQVNIKFATKNERLRRYRDSMQDTIIFFDEFSI